MDNNFYYTGIPQIMGHLRKNGYKGVEALDLNIKIFNFFYNDKNKLIKLWKYLKEEEKKLYTQIQTNNVKDNKDLKRRKKIFALISQFVSKKIKKKKCTML